MSKYYYAEEGFKLLYGDSLSLLNKITPKSVDMIFADPPYFLSGDGITCSGGKMVSVNKGKWDEKISIKEKHKFNKRWIRLCYKVLKDNGSIWISGTMHNIYSIGMALEEEGFKIINNITLKKLNPPPNISCRFFVHSTETILWAKKDLKSAKHKFNYNLMRELNGGKQAKDVWEYAKREFFGTITIEHNSNEYKLNYYFILPSNEDDWAKDAKCKEIFKQVNVHMDPIIYTVNGQYISSEKFFKLKNAGLSFLQYRLLVDINLDILGKDKYRFFTTDRSRIQESDLTKRFFR